jgi:predicted amidohydrolase
MFVAPGEKQRNLQHAAELIREAALNGAKVVLLPEAMTLGWTHPSARQQAAVIPGGEDFEFLRAAAEKNSVYLCGGLIERSGARIYNAAVLLGPRGELLLHYRKINELDIAHDLYSRGDRLGVVDTDLGRFGLMICADAFIEGQVISRTLGAMGAKVILSPSAWAVPADHDNPIQPYGQLWLDNYGPVCRQFGIWIAGCSNVGPIDAGPWAGRNCIGCSLVIDPNGAVVAQGPYGSHAETLIYVQVG